MTDKDFWGKDWMDIQRKYWEGWTDLTRQAMGSASPPTNPWETAMRQWWNTVAPAAPDPARDFAQKIMDQGMGFFRMGEQFAEGLGKVPELGDWSKLAEQWLNGLQQSLSASGESAQDTVNRMMAFWEMPLDNWQRMSSALSLMPGDVLRNMPHRERLDQFLSAPGLGYTREEQAQYQKLARLALSYQRALQDYTRFFSGLGLKSAERMRALLKTRQDENKPVESARELYDLWISACEQTYNEQVMTDEYACLHGKLVNALMAFKAHTSDIIDETLGALNMPTQREMRTVHERLQRTRRETSCMRGDIAALEARLQALTSTRARGDEVSALRDELASLRAELDRLAAEKSAPASTEGTAAPKKSAARKAPAKKSAKKAAKAPGRETGDTAGTA
jgi:class III poly(R)-hydroxyalkanoic acid synthase PhaE subunit